jgi:hypothetical protein
VHFETALNVVWGVLGLLALVNTLRFALNRSVPKRARAKWLHAVGVAMIVAALFPYISATDDVLRIEHLNAQQNSNSHSDKQRQNENLLRLYETIDSPLLSAGCEIALVLFFVSLTFSPTLHFIDRAAPFYTGRSPPPSA